MLLLLITRFVWENSSWFIDSVSMLKTTCHGLLLDLYWMFSAQIQRLLSIVEVFNRECVTSCFHSHSTSHNMQISLYSSCFVSTGLSRNKEKEDSWKRKSWTMIGSLTAVSFSMRFIKLDKGLHSGYLEGRWTKSVNTTVEVILRLRYVLNTNCHESCTVLNMNSMSASATKASSRSLERGSQAGKWWVKRSGANLYCTSFSWSSLLSKSIDAQQSVTWTFIDSRLPRPSSPLQHMPYE